MVSPGVSEDEVPDEVGIVTFQPSPGPLYYVGCPGPMDSEDVPREVNTLLLPNLIKREAPGVPDSNPSVM